MNALDAFDDATLGPCPNCAEPNAMALTTQTELIAIGTRIQCFTCGFELTAPTYEAAEQIWARAALNKEGTRP